MKKKLLKNCNILDVIGERVLERRSVLIDGTRIQKIGPANELVSVENQLPKESVLDIGGRLLMPGLIDSHVHLCTVRDPFETDIVLENLRASETLKVLYGAKNAKQTLEAGFTTVRDVGQGDNLALRDAIERGAILGPRIVACGWLGPTGGHQERMSSEWVHNIPMRKIEAGVDGPWAIRSRVRELIRKGVDCIKTYTGGEGYYKHPWYPYWADQRNYTDEELIALVDEAHAAGRKVITHAFIGNAGVKSAIRTGIDSIEHGVFLEAEDIDKMKQKGIFYTPTLAVGIKLFEKASAKGMARMWAVEEGYEKKYPEAHRASFREALKKGVKIVAGTDSFRILNHGENAFELECMVSAGMSEMQALVSATKVASEAVGLENLIGSVEERKLADLLVVDPSPLADISVLADRANIKLLLKNGELISADL
jgi:imidazolonepropionase-like amidohydrolase